MANGPEAAGTQGKCQRGRPKSGRKTVGKAGKTGSLMRIDPSSTEPVDFSIIALRRYAKKPPTRTGTWEELR